MLTFDLCVSAFFNGLLWLVRSILVLLRMRSFKLFFALNTYISTSVAPACEQPSFLLVFGDIAASWAYDSIASQRLLALDLFIWLNKVWRIFFLSCFFIESFLISENSASLCSKLPSTKGVLRIVDKCLLRWAAFGDCIILELMSFELSKFSTLFLLITEFCKFSREVLLAKTCGKAPLLLFYSVGEFFIV